jgi:hypothetical protein
MELFGLLTVTVTTGVQECHQVYRVTKTVTEDGVFRVITLGLATNF